MLSSLPLSDGNTPGCGTENSTTHLAVPSLFHQQLHALEGKLQRASLYLPPATALPTELTPTPSPTNLASSMASFLAKFDEWVEVKSKEIRANKKAATDLLSRLKEEEMAIREEMKARELKRIELEQVYHKEVVEMDQLKADITKLSDVLTDRIRAQHELEMAVSLGSRELQSKQETLSKRHAIRAQQASRNEPQLRVFRDKLAMEVRSVKEDVLQFIYTHINDFDWNEEFSLVMDVSKVYKVLSCCPELPNLDSLVEWLNTSRDFYTFLKLVRKGFVDLAKSKR